MQSPSCVADVQLHALHKPVGLLSTSASNDPGRGRKEACTCGRRQHPGFAGKSAHGSRHALRDQSICRVLCFESDSKLNPAKEPRRSASKGMESLGRWNKGRALLLPRCQKVPKSQAVQTRPSRWQQVFSDGWSNLNKPRAYKK